MTEKTSRSTSDYKKGFNDGWNEAAKLHTGIHPYRANVESQILIERIGKEIGELREQIVYLQGKLMEMKRRHF
jgi:hypothetical protein